MYSPMMMLSSTLLVLFAIVFANTVSSTPVSKRDVPSIILADMSDMENDIINISGDLSRIPSKAPDVINDLKTHLQVLINTVSTAAIHVEGLPTLTPQDVDDLDDDLDPVITSFFDMLQTFTERVTTIKGIPQLQTAISNDLNTLESAVGAYVNSLISIDPEEIKPQGVGVLFQILAQFRDTLAVYQS